MRFFNSISTAWITCNIWRHNFNYYLRQCHATCNPYNSEILVHQNPCKPPVNCCKHLQCTFDKYFCAIYFDRYTWCSLIYLIIVKSLNGYCLISILSRLYKGLKIVFSLKSKIDYFEFWLDCVCGLSPLSKLWYYLIFPFFFDSCKAAWWLLPSSHSVSTTLLFDSPIQIIGKCFVTLVYRTFPFGL